MINAQEAKAMTAATLAQKRKDEEAKAEAILKEAALHLPRHLEEAHKDIVEAAERGRAQCHFYITFAHEQRTTDAMAYATTALHLVGEALKAAGYFIEVDISSKTCTIKWE